MRFPHAARSSLRRAVRAGEESGRSPPRTTSTGAALQRQGYRDATALATMRAVKAEGGWAVVCTEQRRSTERRHLAFIELRIWDDQDIPMLARIAEAVHAHGALAGIELCAQRHDARTSTRARCRSARRPAAPRSTIPGPGAAPWTRRTSRPPPLASECALRAQAAGYDIVYVYAGARSSAPDALPSRRYNQRSDEYGGSLREPRPAAAGADRGHQGGGRRQLRVACRIAVDELIGERGLSAAEARDMVAHARRAAGPLGRQDRRLGQ